MKYRRMPIEVESPEEFGYDKIRYNLAESSCSDMALQDLPLRLNDLVLMYHDHRGHSGLRGLVAKEAGVQPSEVLTTVGAAAALFMVSTSLLEREDHLVVVRPNYATNIETPRAIGCQVSHLDLQFEHGWRVDLARLESLIQPNTRFVSLTCPHNPTGVMLDEATLRGAIALCERRGIYLLCDETYREMTFGGPLPTAASLSDKAISVSSLSKTYGLPGIRLGWVMTRDPALYETLLAAKEQIFICNSIVDEEIAFQSLAQRSTWLPEILDRIASQFAVTKQWIESQDVLEWVQPQGGVVGFPRIRSLEGPGTTPQHIDVPRFYQLLQDTYATSVGPGHWFEQPDHYMRIGFGWPNRQQLVTGLTKISKALADARR